MSKNLKLIIVILAILAILVGLILPVISSIYWFKPDKENIFSVKQGEGTREIAKSLQDTKAINSAFIFSSYVYANQYLLQVGVYKITPNMNLCQIVQMMHEGKIEEYIVTIPEGWRATQIDELLSQKGIIIKGEFIKVATAKEGYLFPDTYRFPLKTSAGAILKIMTDNFAKKTEGLKITKDVVTLASIVEREAKLDSDRAKIAGVYTNRLNIGMKLDADPTIQYGKGNWNPISKTDYKNFQSAYNTYLHPGLPPTPICNPGLKSLQAALNPEKHDYYYFFTKADSQAVFSKTYQEHLDNLKK